MNFEFKMMKFAGNTHLTDGIYDLRQLLVMDPSNVQAKRSLAKAKKALKEYRQRHKKRSQNNKKRFHANKMMIL